VTATVTTRELSFLDADGEPVVEPASLGPELPVRPSRLSSRQVILEDSRRLIEYRLPAGTAGDPAVREAFEREVGAAVRITRSVRGRPYERRFRLVAGYELNCDEPFALYESPLGEPLTGSGGRTLTIRQRDKLRTDLLVALRVLEGIGLVHGDIRPATVCWDGTAAQLGRPSAAVYAGNPRWPGVRGPYAPPEQRAATGFADCRDDLWSVARVLFVQLTGQEPDSDGELPDLTELPELAGPLTAAFAPLAADRPYVLEILDRLGTRDPLTEAPLPDDGLAAGRARFDALRRDKRGGPDPAPIEPEDGHRDRRRRWGRLGSGR